MNKTKSYEIVYGLGTDEELYFLQKGYRNDVTVNIEGKSYELYFFLDSTLKYEMTIKGYCTFPGLVILDNITTELIETAVADMFSLGYFDYLTPMITGQKRFWDKIYYTPAG